MDHTFSFREARLLAFAGSNEVPKMKAEPKEKDAAPTSEAEKAKPEAIADSKEIREMKTTIDHQLDRYNKATAGRKDAQWEAWAKGVKDISDALATEDKATFDKLTSVIKLTEWDAAIQALEAVKPEQKLQLKEEGLQDLVLQGGTPVKWETYTVSMPSNQPFNWSTRLPGQPEGTVFASAGYVPDSLSPTSVGTMKQNGVDVYANEYKFWLKPGARLHIWLDGDTKEKPTLVVGSKEPVPEAAKPVLEKMDKARPEFQKSWEAAWEAAKNGDKEKQKDIAQTAIDPTNANLREFYASGGKMQQAKDLYEDDFKKDPPEQKRRFNEKFNEQIEGNNEKLEAEIAETARVEYIKTWNLLEQAKNLIKDQVSYSSIQKYEKENGHAPDSKYLSSMQKAFDDVSASIRYLERTVKDYADVNQKYLLLRSARMETQKTLQSIGLEGKLEIPQLEEKEDFHIAL